MTHLPKFDPDIDEFYRENVPLYLAARVTGIPAGTIKKAILDKQVWAYRLTVPECSFETWVVNLRSLGRWKRGSG